jgi:hypothetical protein
MSVLIDRGRSAVYRDGQIIITMLKGDYGQHQKVE